MHNVLVIFTGLEVRVNNVCTGMPQQLRYFMGFGYNPDLGRCGERLDVLDYFRWFAIAGWNPVLLDASAYYIVNRMSPKKVPEGCSAERLIGIIMDELGKKPEIAENSLIRREYLAAMGGCLGIQGRIVDAREMMVSHRYIRALEEMLEFMKVADEGTVGKLLPKDANRASRLYIPLELAEAQYFLQEGIAAKFGPRTEEFFDDLIVEALRKKTVYTTVWCPSPPEGIPTGYLRGTSGCITFSDSPEQVIAKLRDEPYRSWMAGVIRPFAGPEARVEEAVIAIMERINAQNIYRAGAGDAP
ncbi:MAG TPA: hypothetical protein VJC16_02415 [Candidatus Nanoarchaeia archaeon]|nr:hypothetical protein [Candidatus Nanoarchaeia archaeon]